MEKIGSAWFSCKKLLVVSTIHKLFEYNIELFNDGNHCRANQWTGFYIYDRVLCHEKVNGSV